MLRPAAAVAACSMLIACVPDTGPRTLPPPHTAADMPPYQGGYRIPVQGDWRVHRTHYGATNDQSTALDLVVDQKIPRFSKGKTNRDYPSYGLPIVADAPGVVVTVVDGVPDNPPGVVNGYDMHGNYVVIDHKNGEYSLFAHLIPGTIKVRRGELVGMGQVLGACGNSGRSTMAHLHWQVMDHANAHQARGVPVRMMTYEKNGRRTQARLEKGDRFRAVDSE